MTSLAARLLSLFVEQAHEPQRPVGGTPTASGASSLAVVVGGGERAVLPMAAAAAGELRLRSRATTALVAAWRPDTVLRPPAGAATPAARRLAARLAGVAVDVDALPPAGEHGPGRSRSTATACGRLAFLALAADADEAARRVITLRHSLDVPIVLAVCGPRPREFEHVLATADVGVAVLGPDADPDLRALAIAGLRTRAGAVHAPLAAGPPRWAALAGLARLRSLPRADRLPAGDA